MQSAKLIFRVLTTFPIIYNRIKKKNTPEFTKKKKQIQLTNKYYRTETC